MHTQTTVPTVTAPAASTAPAAGATPAPAPVPLPSVHMRVFVTWLAVYPSITIVQMLLGPSIENLSVPVRVLIITGLVVPVVVYALVPVLLKGRAALLRSRRP
ncbi:hypothetical protein [Streptomyces specialis]|uniref:hypothetical protein n=1 Tax=Streptomyces specialis TaxID=498367 RepID=UPI00073E3BCC|nr:hypothetical protein [Streptomyces specialis]